MRLASVQIKSLVGFPLSGFLTIDIQMWICRCACESVYSYATQIAPLADGAAAEEIHNRQQNDCAQQSDEQGRDAKGRQVALNAKEGR